MAKPLTPEERERYGFEAWGLSSKGLSAQAIADRITHGGFGISEKTVRALLAAQARRVASANDKKRTQQLARFESEQRAVIQDAWGRIDRQPEGDLNKGITDAQANITAASVNIARAHGLFVERREIAGAPESPVTVRHEHSFDFDAFRTAFTDVIGGSGDSSDPGVDPR